MSSEKKSVFPTGKDLHVVIVGGGNSSPIMATLAKNAGHTVSIFTRRPKDWAEEIGFLNDDKGYLDGKEKLVCKPDLITDDAKLCIPKAHIIFISGVPVHNNPDVLKAIKPHMPKHHVAVGSICTYGCFNWVAKDILGDDADYSVFGTNLIPWCCGTDKYGAVGHVFGAKRILRCVTEQGKDPSGVLPIMSKILQMPNMVHCDFLTSNLWPNNASLHPPILYGLYKDWDEKTPYDPAKMPKKIYAEMTDASANYVEEMDKELVSIIKALAKEFPDNKFLQQDINMRSCILENYEDQVKDKSTPTSCIRTNKAFASHYLQWVEVEGGIIPKVNHKFFITDVPFGLCVFKDIANMLGLEIPVMTKILEWNQAMVRKEFMTKDGKLAGKDVKETVCPTRFGRNTLKSLIE